MKNEMLQTILSQLSFKEKLFQMTQTIPLLADENDSILTGMLQGLDMEAEEFFDVGSVLGLAGAERVIELQKKYLEKNKHKIPLIFMADIIHGYQTIFPIPIALGASFNETSAYEMARYSAMESAAAGIHVTFSPMVDLVRDPRWGRVMESTGEDPYLNAVFAKAFVEGYQKDLDPKDSMLACVKHFVGYGAGEGGRDYNTVDLTDWNLHNNYLSGFQEAINAGAALVMTAFNVINGIPMTCNKRMIRKILREKLHFEGTVISDWGAVRELIAHGVAETGEDCARLSIRAGVDIEMMTSTYVNYLENLIEEDPEMERLVDEAVMRILELKNRMGLFENPFGGADVAREKEIVLSEQMRGKAREISRECIVLLKNDDVLPLQKDKKLALIGPFGDTKNLLGEWVIFAKTEPCVSIYEGLVNAGYQVEKAKGSLARERNQELLAEAIKTAERADILVLCLGEESKESGEAASKADISIPAAQTELLQEMKKLNKPIVVLLSNGRPLVLTNIVDQADAIVETWFLGTEAGNAIADVISGAYNPSGKLTMSFPYDVGQIPVYYNYYHTGRPKDLLVDEPRYKSKYIDIPNEPLYPFGYGLSYTSFEISDVSVNENTLHVSVCIENTGDIFGTETVQLYISDRGKEVIRPVKELKDFKKVSLSAGEKKTISFQITEDKLVYFNSSGDKEKIKGNIQILIGCSSEIAEGVSVFIED